jgi:hypothetical protein
MVGPDQEQRCRPALKVYKGVVRNLEAFGTLIAKRYRGISI